MTKTLRRAVKHAFDMIPRHASHSEGHIHLWRRLTDSSKGRQADTERGTVNTPQPSQLAAGAFDSPPSHRDPGDRSHYVKCMSITHASGQQRGGGRAPLVVRSLMCEFIKMNHTFSKRLNQFHSSRRINSCFHLREVYRSTTKYFRKWRAAR